MFEILPAQVITKFKIRSNSVVFYPSFELFYCVRGYHAKSQENLLDGRVKGYLSAKSSGRIRDLVENWVNAVKADQLRTKKSLDSYLCFVTLTLPAAQMHPDKFLKRDLLNPFLIYAKRKWKVINFIWKAEPQKNGNLHFHILMDRFIPWQEVRELWNKLLEPLGYIDKFFEKNGSRNPNSSDVHGLIRDKKNREIVFVGAYLAKYISKVSKVAKDAPDTDEKKDRPIEGRLWGCSDKIKELKCFSDYQDSQTDTFYKSLLENQELEIYSGDFFRVFRGKWFEAAKKNVELMQKIDLHYWNEFKKINDLIEIE